MLTCELVGIERGGRILFQDFSLTLFPGACLVIRGANGSGKTSLLRVLSGMDRPEAGVVLWEGEPIFNNATYRQECQFVGHRNAMKPYLTVEQNLLFWARLNGGEMLMPVATHLWQLEPVLDQPFGTLSQGWQRRSALARIMVSPGKVWLMDEPVTNLDAAGVDMFERLVHSRAAQGGIVVITSHIELDLPDADQLMLEDYAL